jgi:hypothetical protein
MGDPSTELGAPGTSRRRGPLLCRHQADTSPSRRSADTLDPSPARELPPSFVLVAPYSTSVSVLLPLMNEYGLFERGVHHVQLAYASYAALLAAFEVTSLLGGGTRGEGNQGNAPS